MIIKYGGYMGEYILYFATDKFELIPGWKEIIIQKALEANDILIDCYDEDKDTINELRELNGYEYKEYKHMTFFRFECNSKNVKELILDRFIDNRLCWFSVFLMTEGRLLFSFEHHASEFTIHGLSKDEIEHLISIMPYDANCIPHKIEV